jgi:2-dehydropantoate 2-reductase
MTKTKIIIAGIGGVGGYFGGLLANHFHTNKMLKLTFLPVEDTLEKFKTMDLK